MRDDELLLVDGKNQDGEWVPIREISRITGVNTVTLRAWERRYGLLIPLRTPKGHRLYSRADIDRVKEIQLWLGRGLAISKVKALLSAQSHQKHEPIIDSHWNQLMQQIHKAINGFQRKSLERLIADTLALYPVEMVADNLLLPVMVDLHGNETGMAARRAFFSQLTLGILLEAQARQRQSATGGCVLLLSATEQEQPLLAQAFGYSVLINQHPVEYLGYLNFHEALLACQALDAKIVVIIGYGDINAAELQLHLSRWQEKSAVPLVLLGEVAIPYPALDVAPHKKVTLCRSQQQAVAYINQFMNG